MPQFTVSDLELVYALYQASKRHRGDDAIQEQLDQVFDYMVSLRLDEAAALLEGF